MDALLVFDPQNNLISIKCNKQFSDYLFEFANENGLKIENKDFNNNEVLRNLLSVLITPYVVSHRYLSDISEIKFDCIRHMNAVYSQSQDFFLLYIYGKTENEVLMQRKVNVLTQIIKFMFGPVIQSMASNHNLVGIAFDMIDKWQTLSESLTFMLESIERLLIGSDLTTLCNNTLQNILRKIRFVSNSCDESPSHIYLFYGLKYITSYSSVNTTKISRGDMLLMLLLSATLEAQATAQTMNGKEEQTEQIYCKQRTSFEISFSKKSLREMITNSNKIETKSNQYLVFLQSNSDQKLLIPYIYRKISIEGNLFVIALSEVPTQISSNLIMLINTINTLVNEPKNKKCCHTVIQLQNCIKRIKEYILKNKLTKDKTYASTLNNVLRLNKCKIFEFVTDLDQNLLNFQTEAQLSLINNCLRESYKTLIFDFYNKLIPRVQTLHMNLFSEVVFYCKKVFADYLGYFTVKSQRNMTLLGINADIEHLIGFVYIDRTVNEMIIAPIECMGVENEINGRIELRDRNSLKELNNNLVNMVFHSYHLLANGNLSTVWTDGVFHYSYVIWFEDSSGSEMEPRVKGFKLESYPSIISDNFIQEIINTSFSKEPKSQRRCHMSENHRSSISCYPYELFCIYNSTKTLDEINVRKNTKKLSTKLWEIGISSEV